MSIPIHQLTDDEMATDEDTGLCDWCSADIRSGRPHNEDCRWVAALQADGDIPLAQVSIPIHQLTDDEMATDEVTGLCDWCFADIRAGSPHNEDCRWVAALRAEDDAPPVVG